MVLKLPDWPPVLTFGQSPPPPEVLDDELELLLEEELDELFEELLLEEDELELLEEEPPPLTTPYGGTGWSFSQVLRDMQLWPFSQPQPLCVFWHNGYSVPHQLHCSPPPLPEVLLEDELLELDELLLEDELEPPPPLTEKENELLVRPAPPCQSSKPASMSIRYQLGLRKPREMASFMNGIRSIFAELTGLVRRYVTKFQPMLTIQTSQLAPAMLAVPTREPPGCTPPLESNHSINSAPSGAPGVEFCLNQASAVAFQAPELIVLKLQLKLALPIWLTWIGAPLLGVQSSQWQPL